jgi:multidrug efflux pump subunit AcrA (membrane-fusion protein)
MYTPEQVERKASALRMAGLEPEAEMLDAYAATLKAAQGGVTDAMVERVSRAIYARAMESGKWLEPMFCDDLATAALAAQQQGEEGFDARKYVRHMADVLEAGGDLFKVDADLARLGAAINAITAPPAQPAERVPEGWVPVTALRDLYRAYVRTLEAGMDRITSLGGSCNSVEDMELCDPALSEARRAMLAASPAPSPARGDGGEG